MNTNTDRGAAGDFIRLLKVYRNRIPKQAVRTLRGQALSGDVAGARKGLEKVLFGCRDLS